jgi:hypothetical protein
MIDPMREHEPDDGATSAILARDMRDCRAVREQAFEFVFAPAMAKGNAMQRCKHGCISRTCIQDRGLSPSKKLREFSDHWRAM